MLKIISKQNLTAKMYISHQPDYGKVIFIGTVMLTPFYSPVIGGITSYVGNLQNSLSKKGVPVSIITGQGRSDDDVQVISSNKLLFFLKAIISIRRKKPDVLHSHAHWYVLLPCVLYKVFHRRTRLIHTFHTEPMKGSAGLRKRMFEYLLSKCDHVTFVSMDLMAKMDRIFKIKSQKTVIYPGVFVEEKGKEEIDGFVSTHDLNDDFPILTFIGPLSWKMKAEGVKKLIEAFTIVIETHPNARLLIVGDGSFRTELENLVMKSDMTDKVIFTGFLENTFIPLSVTHIYTHISLQEGFPIALLEAMSMGKPVMAAKTGGIPEIIIDGENGILVEPEPKQIADNIIALCRDGKRMEELGKNARKTAREEHDWDNIVLEFIDLYKEKS